MKKIPDLPIEVARAFMADMEAFFAAGGTGHKADAIAATQMHILRQYQGPREEPVDLLDIKAMFLAARNGL